MMLVEQTTVPAAALPVAEFTDHLRLGTGFADDGVQDGVLERALRGAMAAIEARTGKVLIARGFLWSVNTWRKLGEQALPVAPVSAISEVRTVDRLGTATIVDAGRYNLLKDDHRPKLVAVGGCLPSIPMGGAAEVIFDAGYGPVWDDLPADLAYATILLAAHFYEHRHATAPTEAAMPYGVTTLIERYRTVRIMGGGAS